MENKSTITHKEMENKSITTQKEGEKQELLQASREELLQEIEQLKARLEQFEKMDSRMVTTESIYLKIGLEESHYIQKSIRDLVSFYNANMNKNAPSTLFNAMRLLEYLTLSYYESKNLS